MEVAPQNIFAAESGEVRQEELSLVLKCKADLSLSLSPLRQHCHVVQHTHSIRLIFHI